MRQIPVIMYHSIRPRANADWAYSHLTLELPYFEMQLAYLARKGYYVASLREVVEFKAGHLPLPRRTVCLTFDDGYLDNWIYAYPLLQKYGYRATIFVAPEFVTPTDEIRRNVPDDGSQSGRRELFHEGFLSWGELRAMQAGGLVDVQSHTMSHTFFPVSNDIVDFRHPGDGHIWMDWNERPWRKWEYMLRGNWETAHYGIPVYRHSPAAVASRIQEDRSLAEHLARYVRRNGESQFFGNPSWSETLRQQVGMYTRFNDVIYRRECRSEYLARLEYEVCESRRIIEDRLGSRVDLLAWPNGGWDDHTHAYALAVGYAATTAKGSPNCFRSSEESRIDRVGLHQVGHSRLISELFVPYKLGAHSGGFPQSQLRGLLARTRVIRLIKRIVY